MNYRSKSKGVRYCGAKGKCGGIVKVINQLVMPDRPYWEPFVGSGKIIQGVTGCRRYGSDIDGRIITLMRRIQEGWEPPSSVSEDEYAKWMRVAKDDPTCIDPMVAFVGFGLSFGARFGQGYARSKTKYVNFAESARTALLRQKPFLHNVDLRTRPYHWGFWHSQPGLMYCDPPYEGTKPVGSNLKPFDNARFWSWAQEAVREGWTVLVSEYVCPIREAKVVWQKEVSAGIRFGTHGDGGETGSGKKKSEKLFLLGGDHHKKIGLGLF